jgi:ABC-type dipeptide/oligopeptide/nickel transport system ATPase component
MNGTSTLLEVIGLHTALSPDKKGRTTVHNVSLRIMEGETVAVVGESGCGKSTLALSILRLIQKPGTIRSGQIKLDGENLLDLPEKDMQRIRGNKISMIFQDPMSALHPCLTLGTQLTEVLRGGSRTARKERAIQMLEYAGLNDPLRIMSSYSFELSGGMLQRVMIAMALMNQPRLLIADEPTTALDVTVQATILRLFKQMKQELGMSILFISHDLNVVAEVADKVAVMHEGELVEFGSVTSVLTNPQHEYTRFLLRMIPRMGERLYRDRDPQASARNAEPQPGFMVKEAVH